MMAWYANADVIPGRTDRGHVAVTCPRHITSIGISHSPVGWREQPAGSVFRFLFSGRSSGNEPDVSNLWDAQHIAEIFYLQYFYLVVYNDDSWLIACSPNGSAQLMGKFV